MSAERRKRLVLAAVAVVALGAVVRHVVPMARRRGDNVAQGREWTGLLKEHATFSARPPAYPVDATFTYAAPTDPNLTRLRDLYELDAVAGSGPEIERIINLMRWVYGLTGHANEPAIPAERNALSLIPLARDEHMMINCYLKTVILNEVYLAMGFASRQTHLLPAEKEDEESHYVASVYSRTLGRWILMDSDFGVYVTDEGGAILGVAEVRRRLIAGEPLLVEEIDPPASVATRVWSNVQSFVTGTSYLWYLRKNFFKVECPQQSLFNLAATPHRVSIGLIPDGYRQELLNAPVTTPRGNTVVFVNDEALFWRAPEGAPGAP